MSNEDRNFDKTSDFIAVNHSSFVVIKLNDAI